MALTLPYSPKDIATLWPYLTPAEQRELESLVNELPIPDLSLKEFVQECWPLVEPASPFIDGWHIDVICDHLQDPQPHHQQLPTSTQLPTPITPTIRPPRTPIPPQNPSPPQPDTPLIAAAHFANTTPMQHFCQSWFTQPPHPAAAAALTLTSRPPTPLFPHRYTCNQKRIRPLLTL